MRKYYVYALVDPREDKVDEFPGKPFYIGKGSNTRMYDPTGEKQEVYSLNLFCEENNLRYQSMVKIANERNQGLNRKYKGWICERGQ